VGRPILAAAGFQTARFNFDLPLPYLELHGPCDGANLRIIIFVNSRRKGLNPNRILSPQTKTQRYFAARRNRIEVEYSLRGSQAEFLQAAMIAAFAPGP
jgi:hypothetical protein